MLVQAPHIFYPWVTSVISGMFDFATSSVRILCALPFWHWQPKIWSQSEVQAWWNWMVKTCSFVKIVFTRLIWQETCFFVCLILFLGNTTSRFQNTKLCRHGEVLFGLSFPNNIVQLLPPKRAFSTFVAGRGLCLGLPQLLLFPLREKIYVCSWTRPCKSCSSQHFVDLSHAVDTSGGRATILCRGFLSFLETLQCNRIRAWGRGLVEVAIWQGGILTRGGSTRSTTLDFHESGRHGEWVGNQKSRLASAAQKKALLRVSSELWRLGGGQTHSAAVFSVLFFSAALSKVKPGLQNKRRWSAWYCWESARLLRGWCWLKLNLCKVSER